MTELWVQMYKVLNSDVQSIVFSMSPWKKNHVSITHPIDCLSFSLSLCLSWIITSQRTFHVCKSRHNFLFASSVRTTLDFDDRELLIACYTDYAHRSARLKCLIFISYSDFNWDTGTHDETHWQISTNSISANRIKIVLQNHDFDAEIRFSSPSQEFCSHNKTECQKGERVCDNEWIWRWDLSRKAVFVWS